MPFDSTRHHRRSIRLAGYDYTQPGAYFVTICAYQRQPLFRETQTETPTLSQIGRIVDACWRALPRHFPHMSLDTWVIMPDHLHGIIRICDTVDADNHASSALQPNERPNGTRSGSLNAIIQNFKSISTRKANRVRQMYRIQLWQRDYYEAVIRDDRHLHNVYDYIEKNRADMAR